MILLAYLFVGSIYAAFASSWLEKNTEEGASFGFGLTCFLLWPVLMFIELLVILSQDSE